MRKQKTITRNLFMIYFILLTWIILMKTEFSFETVYRMRSLNLIPLEGTAVRNNQLDYQEIYLNILIFVPFGLYLSMMKPNWSFLKKLFPIFLVSFIFESLQYIFSIGATDITDLIGNTLGGVLGIFSYYLVSKGIKDRLKTNHFFNLFGMSGSLLFFFLFILLSLLNN